MNIKEVKDLIQEVLQSDICEFELEHTGTKIRLRRGSSTLSSPPPIVQTAVPVAVPSPIVTPVAPPLAPVLTEEQSEPLEEDNLHIITSPIVGTFYRTPTPGAQPYVNIGDTLEEGAILCIVEAMKLMNEIPSDVAGEVMRIYVENGHPVEFGQKLFAIRPRK